jgi:hypothetical protein
MSPVHCVPACRVADSATVGTRGLSMTDRGCTPRAWTGRDGICRSVPLLKETGNWVVWRGPSSIPGSPATVVDPGRSPGADSHHLRRRAGGRRTAAVLPLLIGPRYWPGPQSIGFTGGVPRGLRHPPVSHKTYSPLAHWLPGRSSSSRRKAVANQQGMSGLQANGQSDRASANSLPY